LVSGSGWWLFIGWPLRNGFMIKTTCVGGVFNSYNTVNVSVYN
jgi:hypothetical protein